MAYDFINGAPIPINNTLGIYNLTENTRFYWMNQNPNTSTVITGYMKVTSVTNSTGVNLILPDATQGVEGTVFIIRNDNAYPDNPSGTPPPPTYLTPINIVKNGGTTGVASVPQGETMFVILLDASTTDGVWEASSWGDLSAIDKNALAGFGIVPFAPNSSTPTDIKLHRNRKNFSFTDSIKLNPSYRGGQITNNATSDKSLFFPKHEDLDPEAPEPDAAQSGGFTFVFNNITSNNVVYFSPDPSVESGYDIVVNGTSLSTSSGSTLKVDPGETVVFTFLGADATNDYWSASFSSRVLSFDNGDIGEPGVFYKLDKNTGIYRRLSGTTTVLGVIASTYNGITTIPSTFPLLEIFGTDTTNIRTPSISFLNNFISFVQGQINSPSATFFTNTTIDGTGINITGTANYQREGVNLYSLNYALS